MSAVTLSAILLAHKVSRVPLDIVLPGGHRRRVLVRTVGHEWFSANDIGVLAPELVVAFRAALLVSEDSLQGTLLDQVEKQIPLRAMLSNLQRQRTQVLLHLEGLELQGVVIDVFGDCMSFFAAGTSRVVIPLERFLWLEVCG